MKKLDMDSAIEELARVSGKWLVRVSLSWSDEAKMQRIDYGEAILRVLRAVPWLDIDGDGQALSDEVVVALCDSEEEAQAAYEAVSGDDNPREGAARCYAILVSPVDGVVTENT